jgi:hypothetical protein
VRRLAIVVIFMLGCGKQAGAPASDQPAGKVVALEGEATATRAAEGSPKRNLSVAAPVWADDTVAAAAGATLRILLAHNEVTWTLEGGTSGSSRRVDQSLAWAAPKGTAASETMAPAEKDRTASAGRHAEMEAAGTEATAPKKEEAAPVPDEAKTAPPPPPPAAAAAPAPAAPPAQAPSPKASKPAAHRADGADTFVDRSGGGGPASVKLAIATFGVRGALTEAAARKVIDAHLDEVKSCVAAAGRGGKLTLSFVVEADGKVSDVVSFGDLAKVGGQCAGNALHTWAFPTSAGRTRVGVGFNVTQ